MLVADRSLRIMLNSAQIAIVRITGTGSKDDKSIAWELVVTWRRAMQDVYIYTCIHVLVGQTNTRQFS